jgi:hypothetical protein
MSTAWQVWQDIFGPSVNRWPGMAMSIFVSVTFIVFAIGGYKVIHETVKATDVGFSKARLDKYNERQVLNGFPARAIDWQKVYIQRVRSFGFSLPFGALVLAVLVWWLRESFDLLTYFKLAGVLLVCSPLLRVWWIATAVRTERRLAKHKLPAANDRELASLGVVRAIRCYLAWGLNRKSVTKRPPFIGLLRPLNPFVKLAGLRWLQWRMIVPIVSCAFIACTWALSWPIAVFYLTTELDERHEPLKPDWADNTARKPIFGGPVIADTPGDAAAAGS